MSSKKFLTYNVQRVFLLYVQLKCSKVVNGKCVSRICMDARGMKLSLGSLSTDVCEPRMVTWKLTVPNVGLFLLLALDWKTLVLMSGDFPLQMQWCQNASNEKSSTSGCHSRLTDVCA